MGAMTFSKIEKIIFDLAEPIAEENGIYIYDVEFIKEGGHWFLRVYLDKPEENEYYLLTSVRSSLESSVTFWIGVTLYRRIIILKFPHRE